MDRLEERPLVSCHIITYNQKDYISKCIEGALMQETSFPYEIVIGDDCSTDGTREILINYAKNYPEKIRLNLREKRGKGIPGQENFHSTLSLCKGKYVALCDGDDYWYDKNKIQLQADYLETHSDCVITSHNARVINEKDEFISESLLDENNKRSFESNELVRGPWIPSLTRMFRNNLVVFTEDLKQCLNGDLIFTCLLGTFGRSHYIPDIKNVAYRIQSKGVWSSESETRQFIALYFTLITLQKHFIYDRDLRDHFRLRSKQSFQDFFSRNKTNFTILKVITFQKELFVKSTSLSTLGICLKLSTNIIFPRIFQYPYFKLRSIFIK
jgi:glycosyltransferase involved in cell wall biosynthesis